MSIGEDLAEARRRSGLSLTQVSQRTCIREAIIRDIESDEYGACGGDFYARGHIRSIARAVGTDPAPLIRDYDVTHQPPRPDRATDLFGPVMPLEPPRRHLRKWITAAGFAVLVVLAFGVYHFAAGGRQVPGASRPAAAQQRHSARHPHAAPTAAPAATAPAASAQPYAHDVVIRLTAIEDCWVEFTTPQGGYLFQSYVFGGTTKTWTFRHAVDMALGNPGGVRLTVDARNPLPPGTGNPITLHLGLNGQISG